MAALGSKTGDIISRSSPHEQASYFSLSSSRGFSLKSPSLPKTHATIHSLHSQAEHGNTQYALFNLSPAKSQLENAPLIHFDAKEANVYEFVG